MNADNVVTKMDNNVVSLYTNNVICEYLEISRYNDVRYS